MFFGSETVNVQRLLLLFLLPAISWTRNLKLGPAKNVFLVPVKHTDLKAPPYVRVYMDVCVSACLSREMERMRVQSVDGLSGVGQATWTTMG